MSKKKLPTPTVTREMVRERILQLAEFIYIPGIDEQVVQAKVVELVNNPEWLQAQIDKLTIKVA